ncbi:MAG: hypothetical protein EWV53_13260, partial [Microcystis panniformis Mp_MB_F_20051200_S9]
SLLDLQYIFSSAFFCLKLDNFFQISSFFIPQNKIDALLGRRRFPADRSRRDHRGYWHRR